MREKDRRDNVTILCHTCASKQHHNLHDRESLVLSLSYTSGNFHYRTWLVYSNNKQVGCTPTQFLLLRFHTFIALVASVAWKSLLLALTSIGGNLHSPLISLVDVRLSPFCILHITPLIIFYSTQSAMSMARAHILSESLQV